MTTTKPWQDKKILHQLYCVEKKSTIKIGLILHCSKYTINRWLKKFDISIRSISESHSGKLNPNYRPVEERFWEKVDKSNNEGCWIWLAYKNNKGYGEIGIKHKLYLSHRISWIIHFGSIPKGMCVCHKCDNPGCVNPHHLFLGTQKDNMQDMSKKNRANPICGVKHCNAKLSEKQVLEIRKKYSGELGEQMMLSKEYGVSTETISRIVNNKMWKHL